MRTLWITGVAGFTGRHLTRLVTARPDRPRIVGLDVVARPPLPLDGYERVDLCDADAVAALAVRDPPAWIVHLAGALPPASPADMWTANVTATSGLLLGLAAADCRAVRLLSIGSAAEYRLGSDAPLTERSPAAPATPYGRTKLAQTLLVLGARRTLGVQASIARTFNLVGPGLPSRLLAGRLCEQFLPVAGPAEVELQTLDTSRDFLDVRDAVDAYWRIVTAARTNRIYNVCSGRAVGVRELVRLFGDVTDTQPAIRTVPARDRVVDPAVVVGCARRLHRETGWAPTIPLVTSVRDMIAAGRANGGSQAAGTSPAPASRGPDRAGRTEA